MAARQHCLSRAGTPVEVLIILPFSPLPLFAPVQFFICVHLCLSVASASSAFFTLLFCHSLPNRLNCARAKNNQTKILASAQQCVILSTDEHWLFDMQGESPGGLPPLVAENVSSRRLVRPSLGEGGLIA